MEGTTSVSSQTRPCLTQMNAQQILTTMRGLSTLGELQTKIKEAETTVEMLFREVDRLTKCNREQEEMLKNIFKQMRCPTCTQYLESKREGDTLEGRPCHKVFLSRCMGV